MEALRAVLHNLSDAMVYSDCSNTQTNRKLWNEYAKNWKSDSDETGKSHPLFVEKMAQDVGREHLTFLGDEWSDEYSLQGVLSSFLFPYFDNNSNVCEIGVGGGRIAARVLHRGVKKFVGFDISSQMIQRTRAALGTDGSTDATQGGGPRNAQLVLLEGDNPSFDPSFHGRFQLVYSFDVMVHVDLHTIFAYLKQIKLLLAPTGKAFLHTANLTAPLGFERFSKQKSCTAGGFYFLSPEMIRVCCKNLGFRIVKESYSIAAESEEEAAAQAAKKATGGGAETIGDKKNMYYNRDYLFVIEQVEK